MSDVENLVKSKQRVVDHGEVFTPSHIVNAMLDLVKDESERIDSRFLEPACGEGNFLVQVLHRKLATVESRYGKNEFERRHYALLALMCIYGIELLEDNAELCRENLLDIFSDFIQGEDADVWRHAAEHVLALNILQADALTMKRADGETIVFAEWGYLGKGKYQRRDFTYETLTYRAAAEPDLFGAWDDVNVFQPCMVHKPMSVSELAQQGK